MDDLYWLTKVVKLQHVIIQELVNHVEDPTVRQECQDRVDRALLMMQNISASHIERG